MFPTKLDDAEVLYYTPKDYYGTLQYPNGEISDYYRYLAICKYPDSKEYYLFCCDENFEVVFDWIDRSVKDCMRMAASSYKENIIWIQAHN